VTDFLEKRDGIIFRRCTQNDLKSVKEVNIKTQPNDGHPSDYVYNLLLSECSEAFIVAEKDNKIIGYVMCATDFGYSNFETPGLVKRGHMISGGVLDEYRKQGVMTTILDLVHKGLKEKKCNETYLDVRHSNEIQKNLHIRFGMKIQKTLESYYRDGENSYRMIIKY
tara:strand:+ start:550 stop:1050 length:501 start_codon:yes stop_codon:yes gene_type:complete